MLSFRLCCSTYIVQQRRFSIVLKGPRNFGIVVSIAFNFESRAAFAPVRVTLSFEALKPGIDLSLVMKVLDSNFFQLKAVSSYTEIYTV